MTGAEEVDLEFAEIRARRVEELLARGERRPPPQSVTADLTVASFPAFLAAHSRAIVDVWAPWCGPCRTMAPILDALAHELSPEVQFGKLNADTAPGLAERWNVEGIPTLLLFEQGRLADRVVGAHPQKALRARIRAVYRLGKDRGQGDGKP